MISHSPLDAATSASKPKDRKPKARKGFWSANSRELDRIGWNTRYAFSDSDETSDEEPHSDRQSDSSSSSSDSSDSEKDSSKNDSGQDIFTTKDNETLNKNSITITTTINQIPSPATPLTDNNSNSSSSSSSSSSNNCQCHHILKRQLDSYDADIRQQILLEVYNWLNGGEHDCSSLSASVFASSSTSTVTDGSNDTDNNTINAANLTLTQQQKNDYHHLVNWETYWREVYWADNTQTSDNEEVITDIEEAISTQTTQVTSTNEDWQDEEIDILNIQANAEIEWIMVLVFVMLGQLGMVVVAECVIRWLGV